MQLNYRTPTRGGFRQGAWDDHGETGGGFAGINGEGGAHLDGLSAVGIAHNLPPARRLTYVACFLAVLEVDEIDERSKAHKLMHIGTCMYILQLQKKDTYRGVQVLKKKKFTSCYTSLESSFH